MNFFYDFLIVNSPVIAAILCAFIPMRFLDINAYISLFKKILEVYDEEENESKDSKYMLMDDIQLTLNVQDYIAKQTKSVVKVGCVLFGIGFLADIAFCICAYSNIEESMLINGIKMILIPLCSFVLYFLNTLKIFRVRCFVVDLGKAIFPSSKVGSVCKELYLNELFVVLFLGLAASLLLFAALCFYFIVKYNLLIS